jgi:hypothetical protein
MNRLTHKIVLVSMMCACSAASNGEERIRGDGEIIRLPPAAFSDLPEPVRVLLAEESCLIPQPWRPGAPPEYTNVVRGEFAVRGQYDWAVVCLRAGKSSIRLFWGGPSRCSDSFAEYNDAAFLQTLRPNEIGYSRMISRVSPDDLTQRYGRQHNQSTSAPLPKFDHDAISDAFLEKASTLYYCSDTSWHTLRGSD